MMDRFNKSYKRLNIVRNNRLTIACVQQVFFFQSFRPELENMYVV